MSQTSKGTTKSAVKSGSVTSTSSSASTQRKLYKQANQSGRPATGCYPEIDREILARRVGTSASFASYILMGRTTPRMDLAIKMARVIGVPLEEFNRELIKAAKRYRQAKLERNQAVT